MSHLFPLCLLAAALLLPAGAEQAAAAAPARQQQLARLPGVIWPKGYTFHYEVAEAAFVHQLHDACRRCTAVAFNYSGERQDAAVVRTKLAP